MLNIPCVIFAGGKSSRMGRDKSLLPFSSYKTLTEFQLHKLKQIFKTVYISCKNKNKFNFDANFIEDIESDNVYAPTVGFISVFEYIKEDSFFVISVDTPFIDKHIILSLIQKDDKKFDATIATLHNKIQPMCGIYHCSLKNEFEQMLKNKNHKLGLMLKNSNTNYINFKSEDLFININNPQEYKNALKRCK